MKKIAIIGAGIAGLTAGIYAQKNGFDTEIFEMHTIAGGECTGWDRGDYHFDGCIHWLVGSKQGTGLHEVWRNTGALNDDVDIINHEVFMRYKHDDQVVNIYTNADKLEKHLIEISPQDKKEIKKLTKAIRAFSGLGMPVDKPMDMMTASDGLKYMFANIGKIGLMMKFNKISMKDYVKAFKSEVLRGALLNAIPGEYNANALVFTLAGTHIGDSGYPHGGSRAFARRMEKRYIELGGKIRYKAKVDEIIVEDGKAVGVRLIDRDIVKSDYVVSCADGYATLYHMLKDKYTPKIYRTLFENPKEYFVPTCAIAYFGVNQKIEEDVRALSVSRKKPCDVGGVKSNIVSILNYAYDSTMAPEGKTVMSVYYEADYDYWKKLDKQEYRAEKKKLEQDALKMLVQNYPETEGKVEVADVVTPMTYVRYCNAWRGAWMSWADAGKDFPQYFNGLLPNLENFIMAGMWTMTPGGLPTAAATGKFAIQRLCINEGREFIK